MPFRIETDRPPVCGRDAFPFVLPLFFKCQCITVVLSFDEKILLFSANFLSAVLPQVIQLYMLGGEIDRSICFSPTQISFLPLLGMKFRPSRLLDLFLWWYLKERLLRHGTVRGIFLLCTCKKMQARKIRASRLFPNIIPWSVFCDILTVIDNGDSYTWRNVEEFSWNNKFAQI